MDGDAVTAEPSQDDQDETEEPSSLAELFENIFPYYLSMGMTYDEFWLGRPSLARAYRKAFEMRMQRQNWEAWWQGMYIYDALVRVSPIFRALTKGNVKPEKYPDEPYPMTAKDAKEREERIERENFNKFLKQMEASSDRELRRREEAAKKQEMVENGNH